MWMNTFLYVTYIQLKHMYLLLAGKEKKIVLLQLKFIDYTSLLWTEDMFTWSW